MPRISSCAPLRLMCRFKLHKVSKTGWAAFSVFHFFVSLLPLATAPDRTSSSLSKLNFFIFCILTPEVIWEIVLLLSFCSAFTAFVSGKFFLQAVLSWQQSVQFSHSQVSMQLEEMAFVLGQSPFAGECSFYQGIMVWNWKVYCLLLWPNNVYVCPLLCIPAIASL